MKYQIITEKYIAAAALTEAAYLDTAWSAAQIADAMARDDTLYLIATKDGNLCATASCVFSIYEGMIENIAVKAEFRRQGIALGLLEYIGQEAKRRGVEQLCLEVASRNAAAIALYQNAGFIKAGVRKGFYSKQKDDALVMIKEIN